VTSLIGVDWSVESFRAWRLDARGAVTDRRESADGLRRAARRGHEKTLLRHVGGWLEPGSTVVLASSMADRRGWIETPLLALPTDLGALLDAAVHRNLRGVSLLALPGVADRTPGASDVMRRETLLALGGVDGRRAERRDDDASTQRLLVLPGARTRWIRVVDGRVAAFRTAIGGELLARLLDGPFGKALPAGETNDGAAFMDGVEQGYRTRHVVTDLFSARAAVLLDERDPELVRACLSGLVLGNEIREAEVALEATGEALTLIGDDALCAPYARALRHLGTTVGRDAAETAAIAAFRAVRAALAAAPPLTVPIREPSPDAPSDDGPNAPSSGATPDLATVAASSSLTIENPASSAPTRRDWGDVFARLPLVAFLPTGESRQVVAAATVMVEAGFRILVVSMRDAHAPETIRRLSEAFGSRLCIGVRDVPTPKRVSAAIDAGARAVIATATDAALARRCARHDVPWIPGVATVTEATAALALGARALLLYPAAMIEPRAVRAMRRALPPDAPLVPAGGLDARTLVPYAAAGADGAVADEIPIAGAKRTDVVAAARAFVEAWRRIERGRHTLDANRSGPPPPPASTTVTESVESSEPDTAADARPDPSPGPLTDSTPCPASDSTPDLPPDSTLDPVDATPRD